MKYVVNVPEVHYIQVYVDAGSEEEAKEVANQVYEEGIDDLNSVYSHTMETDMWSVSEIR